jgi:hypothetical protein
MSRRIQTLRTPLALAAVGILLAACSENAADANDKAGSAPSSSAEESSAPTAEVDLPDGVLALPDDDPGEDFASLDAGRYRIALDDTLAFDVDVPDKTYSHSDGLFLSTGPVVLKTEIAGESYGVPDNACQDNDIEAVGPTVTDLVTAIHDTRPYRVSAPEHVRFAGARGTYLEIRIPAGYDATPCHDHLVALPGNPGTYNNLEPGYIGKWWILDVDGQRVVVQQNCLCAPQRLDGADSIPRSIAFTPSS